MIAYYIVCLAAIILALQFAVAPKTARHLTLHYSLDAQLAEPGEKIAFSAAWPTTGFCRSASSIIMHICPRAR